MTTAFKQFCSQKQLSGIQQTLESIEVNNPYFQKLHELFKLYSKCETNLFLKLHALLIIEVDFDKRNIRIYINIQKLVRLCFCRFPGFLGSYSKSLIVFSTARKV